MAFRLSRALAWLPLVLAGAFVAGFFVSVGNRALAGSQYQSQVEGCLSARAAGNPRSISDYVCPDNSALSDQDVAYQVVLDLEFRKLDTQIKAALADFQKSREKDPTKLDEQIKNWFDDTAEKPEFAPKFRDVCTEISLPGNPLYEAVQAFTGGVTTDGATSSFLRGESSCSALVDRKLAAYRDIARLVALQDTVSGYAEDKDAFTGKLKQEYERFLMEWTIYIGELARIKDKWPSKTKIQNGQ